MPDYPPGAVQAAADAIDRALTQRPGTSDEALARVALEAAAPLIEQDIRERVAADLRRAAEGRREYAAGLGEDGIEGKTRATLLTAAEAHESSAHIAVDPRSIMSVIPSWRWTDEEAASLREVPRS